MADGNTGQGNSLDTISIRITASATTAARSVDQLTNSLTNLRNAVSGSLSGLSSLSASLGSLSASLTNLRTATEGVGNLRNSLRGLSGIDLTNVTNSMRELANLDFNANGIREAVQDLQGLTQQVTGLSEAIRGVPDFNLRGMERLNGQFRSGANHGGRFLSVLGGLKGAVTAIVSSQLIGAMKQMIGSTNDYIEAMNLARVSLGDYADEAARFGEAVSGALGIDQGTLLENMGLFQNLSTSFGVSADNAYILSKNMAQLAYDFASFHNLDLEESFLKFQSALAGELEPIRRVGVDISNARLQQELYDLGLRQSISTLGRADKAVLTYIAIMKQSTNEMGDMARTIQSPANMLRVLGNQATITGRQIGALFIPALQEILPWAIAVMKVIGQLASTLASLAGFNMEDYLANVDGSAFEGMAGDIEDVGAAAGKAAKQMNNLIGGFDELNILKKASESAGTGVIGGNLLDNIDLSKYQYDMLEGLVGKNLDKYIRQVTKYFNAFKDSAAVKAATEVLKFFWEKGVKPLGEWIVAHPDSVANWIGAIGAAIVTYNIARGIGSLVSGLASLRGAVSSGGLIGGLRTLGGIFTNPWALAIGAVAAAIVGVGLAVWQTNEKARKARLDEIFGDITLSFEEVQKAAEALSSTELSIKLNAYVDETDVLGEMRETVNATISELQTQQWLASIGIDIDLEAYSVSIDNVIAQTQEALNQQEQVYTMAISIGVNAENVSSEMSEFVSQYMGSSRTQLEGLGKELRATVDNALADGVLSGDELKTITNLQAEMQEVMNRVAQAEYSAQWKAFSMDWSGVDLTFESWSEVMDSANAMIQEQTSQLEGVRLQNLQIAELALAEGQITPERYDSWISEIENTFQQNKLSLTANLDQFAINTIGGAYQEVIDQFGAEASADVLEAFNNSWETALDGTQNFNISKFMSALEYEIELGLPGLQGSVTSILENIKPQEHEWLAQKAYYEEMGMEVPESITAGLESIEKLKALENGSEGMYAAIRETIATSSEVKAAIAQAGLSADNLVGTLVEGLWEGNTYAANAGSGLVGVTTASIEQKVIDDAATVKDAGKDVGDNFWDGLKEKWNSIKSWWNGLDLGNKVGTSAYYNTRSYSAGGIPQLASGNVATDPTLALFGEYPGAKSNPEITAPQSTIYETVVAANGEMVNAVYQMATMIVQAIESNSTEISVDSRGLFKAVKKEASAYQKSHGVPAF